MRTTSPTHTDFASRTLADIAIMLPGATALFRREKLDFCCGGKTSLREAAAAKRRDLAALTTELQRLGGTVEPLEEATDTAALIARIADHYHATHRRELPELIRLARRVEAVHRDVASAPHGIAGLLERMAGELESHMREEEQILFPLMLQGGDADIGEPIATMLAEHDDQGEHLRALEALTNDFIPPPEACTTWRALYAGAHKLAADLVEHIHIENNILFPRFAG